MQEEVTPPVAVTGLNLVDTVWPTQEKPRPEVRFLESSLQGSCHCSGHCSILGKQWQGGWPETQRLILP